MSKTQLKKEFNFYKPIWFVISLLASYSLLAVGIVIGFGVYIKTGHKTINVTDINYISLIRLIIMTIVTFVIHEAFHAVFFKRYGGKIKFGFNWYGPYTRDLSEKYYKPKEFIKTLMAPFIFVNIITLIPLMFITIYPGTLILNFAIALAGCSMDIIMSIYILVKAENNDLIKDAKNGFQIYQTMTSR